MCGIVGAISKRNHVIPVLLEGLKRLEYRGYDSCGLATLGTEGLKRVRSVERVAELARNIEAENLTGSLAIAHTRWATHGGVITENAHPIFSGNTIALVHNGIIENHETLRTELKARGYIFSSQTDSEVIAHLIADIYQQEKISLREAVHQATQKLQGAYAIAVFSPLEPQHLICVRTGSPLVIGLGENENFLASDALALAGAVDHFIYLEDGDLAELSCDAIYIFDAQGKAVERKKHILPGMVKAVELGPYQHYMQKEIFEQPDAIANTLSPIEHLSPELFGEAADTIFERIDSILILACGTSYYAGMVAKYWLEAIAKIPTQVEIASEYRYRASIARETTLVVAISQSGETADTLSALKHAQSLGQSYTLGICNVATSSLMRQVALKYLTHAGTEIGVASTKAFTTQLLALFILTLVLAQKKSSLQNGLNTASEAPHDFNKYLEQLRHLPIALHKVLALEPQIIGWAEQFSRKENALFLGRGLHYPIALEGALKLKEISYIHAEAYPAGELKHGPLALVTDAMPVVTVAPNDALLEKLKSNIEEVRARGGQLYVFADADTHMTASQGVHIIRLPEHYGWLSPILHVVPLQLLAYHVACIRGSDVDKPRNLAKSVTVE